MDEHDHEGNETGERKNYIIYLKDSREALIKGGLKDRLKEGNLIALIVADEEDKTYILCRQGFKRMRKHQQGQTTLGAWVELEAYETEGKRRLQLVFAYYNLLPTRVTISGVIYIYVFLEKRDGTFFNEYIGPVSDKNCLIPPCVECAAAEVKVAGYRHKPLVVKYHGSVRIPNEVLPEDLRYQIPEDDELGALPINGTEKTLKVLVGDEQYKFLMTEHQRRNRLAKAQADRRDQERHFPTMVMNRDDLPDRFKANINFSRDDNECRENCDAQALCRPQGTQTPSQQNVSISDSNFKQKPSRCSNGLPTVLITNVGFELGSSLARKYLENNYNVVLHNCGSDVEDDVKKSLIQQVTDRLHVVSFDLLKLDEVRKCLEEKKEIFGHIDVLIHIAMAKCLDLCEEKDYNLNKFLMEQNVNSTRNLFIAMKLLSFHTCKTEVAVVTNLEPDEALAVPETVRNVERWLEYIVHGFKQIFKGAVTVTRQNLTYLHGKADDSESRPHIRHLSHVLKSQLRDL
ncbi:unnamed protein product [Bursaphelenchus xylophilus]|uniref:(pine wood nematode) hypothetical protein n=1 Tax=Bursaphelenchus xylophilus TaxID=6326 RepID=A0A1I7RS80_BURXY|nr:unnamed protein product [Bursaphelenchus xylophilus]CAG9123137.1 unnamed protein product [Bursaphelenchus xylophilus]